MTARKQKVEISELIENGSIHAAVCEAFRQAKRSAKTANGEPWHVNLGKFRVKMDAEINMLLKIRGRGW